MGPLDASSGRRSFGDDPAFNGVKVFSATLVHERETLGERVTAWLARDPEVEVRELVVTQSSDQAFHCLTITVFYWRPPS